MRFPDYHDRAQIYGWIAMLASGLSIGSLFGFMVLIATDSIAVGVIVAVIGTLCVGLWINSQIGRERDRRNKMRDEMAAKREASGKRAR
ncbi:hypothetical protein [Sediminimonas sp.]|uniref:hypothetical protein n=1 Tax=Sediminimonas sp. TaxID=2823379 RepID=UPI0025E2398D|nr:hypothetical protein [Sediminimonas sp.]